MLMQLTTMKVFAGWHTDPLCSAIQDIIDSHSKAKHQDSTDSEQLSADYNQLNADLKHVVDKVVSSVCSNSETLHLIVSGQGRTGKSRVIELINRLVTHNMSHTSSILCYTVFQFSVKRQHYLEQQYRKLKWLCANPTSLLSQITTSLPVLRRRWQVVFH